MYNIRKRYNTLNNIICADCLDILKHLPENSVDLLITSPPYNIGKKYSKHSDNLDNYLEWLLERLVECARVSKAMWINLGYQKTEQGNIPIAFQIYDKIPMFLNQHVVWHYGAGMAYKKRFNHRKEDWLWYIKESYTFNLDAIRIPSKYPKQYKDGKLKVNPKGKNCDDVWDIPKVTTGRASPERKNHPAQFPEKMIERIIKACSNENDLILDPFNGAGTTTTVAKKLNRNYLGIDIDEEYCKIAKRRLNDR